MIPSPTFSFHSFQILEWPFLGTNVPDLNFLFLSQMLVFFGISALSYYRPVSIPPGADHINSSSFWHPFQCLHLMCNKCAFALENLEVLLVCTTIAGLEIAGDRLRDNSFFFDERL